MASRGAAPRPTRRGEATRREPGRGRGDEAGGAEAGVGRGRGSGVADSVFPVLYRRRSQRGARGDMAAAWVLDGEPKPPGESGVRRTGPPPFPSLPKKVPEVVALGVDVVGLLLSKPAQA